MRKMQNTLYIVSDDLLLSLENDNAVVRRDDMVVNRFPLHTLETVVTFSRKGITVPFISACASHEIPIFIMSVNGNLISKISVPSQGSILLRKNQYRISDQPEKSGQIAASFVTGKLRNQKHMIDRFLWEHPDHPDLREASGHIHSLLRTVSSSHDISILRGLEGTASAAYYSCFQYFIRNDSECFRFHGRSRRPPLDRTNAMLSFGYSLLTAECIAALESVGLDASAGFFHQDHVGRKSLACDLVEEFRPIIVDRFVLHMINEHIIHPDHFDLRPDGSVLMNHDGRKVFLHHWQLNRKKEIMHPYLQETVSLGLLPYAQAVILARTVRGDIPEYQPFFRR